MLDIHPPEHTPHTWRDFFIHMGTIILGLCIAIGLEQTAELIHHRHERRQLREDLMAEAQLRVERLRYNEKLDANDIAWYRAILRAGREATVSGRFVTFVMPRKVRMGYITVVPNGVWPAAKASGEVTLLPRDETELWDQVDSFNALTEKSFDTREDALRAAFANLERTGDKETPGVALRLTPADRDEQMLDTSTLLEATWMLERNDALWEGACEAMLHGAKTGDEVYQYEDRAVAAMPN